jgi:hypothetical protein
MGITPDNYPHIGELPGREGQYICAGFNGGGMSYIFLCAKGLASMIRDGVSFEQTGLPAIFKVTDERIQEEMPKDRWTKPKGKR